MLYSVFRKKANKQLPGNYARKFVYSHLMDQNIARRYHSQADQVIEVSDENSTPPWKLSQLISLLERQLMLKLR